MDGRKGRPPKGGIGASGSGISSNNVRGAGRPATRISSPSPTSSASTAGIRPPTPSSNNPLSGPNFTNDILNHLPPPRRQEMLNLVSRFRAKHININEFLASSRSILGEQLYSVLARGMSSAGKKPPTPGRQTSMPSMSGDPHSSLGKGGNNDDESAGMDVNRMDSAALQDVIQYAGVDLKEESELFLRHHEQHHFLSLANQQPLGKDIRLRHDHWLNGARLKSLVSNAVLPQGVVDMNEDCLDLIAAALQRRLADVVTDLVAISRHRVDMGRAHFKIKIDNDPKRLTWLVDQYLAGEDERVKNGQGALGSSDALAMARAKMRKMEGASGGGKRGGEDAVVKTKLANVTAAVATGLQLKSWMTDPSIHHMDPSTNPNNNTNSPSGTQQATSEPHVVPPLHFSQAASMTPISDRELHTQYAARTVASKDLIYYMENDPHLRHSNILLSLYNTQT